MDTIFCHPSTVAISVPTLRLFTLIHLTAWLASDKLKSMKRWSKKDKGSFLRVISGICGNLSAAWYGFILISPEFGLWSDPDNILGLTRSALFGTLFLLLAFISDKSSK